MSVEEVLVVDEGVRVAELHDLLVRLGGGQHPQARPRVEEQRRPQHLSAEKARLSVLRSCVRLRESWGHQRKLNTTSAGSFDQ